MNFHPHFHDNHSTTFSNFDFETVIAKAKTACINSGQRVGDHFVGSDQLIEIGRLPDACA